MSADTPVDSHMDLVMLPASFAQELLWITDRASPGSLAYNVPRTRRLTGALDVDALRRAFDALVARHEILRTTYATHDDQVVQVIHPPRPVPFEIVDLTGVPANAREAEAARVVRERTARPFDLANDLLLRVTLLRLAETEHVLLFESHHIAFDGWSRDIVFRELTAFYEAFTGGRPPALDALPIQYADFAIWQREEFKGERLGALLGWWRDELGDAEHVLRLPTDFTRPAVSRNEGVTATIVLPPDVRDAIRRLGQRYDATTYMVLLAAYTTVLHRYTGQGDVLVGSPIAGRARSETEGLIGYFANTIVQRARFAGDPSFSQLLVRLRESALGAYDHQDVPFEKLVLELEGRTGLGESPLFQVVFTQLDTSQAPDARMGAVALGPFANDAGTTKFDLTFFMLDQPAGLTLMLRGRADLHHAATIERLLGHIRTVLEAAVANPDTPVSALPLLTPAERAALASWNATAVDEGPPATVVALFDAQAARVPDRLAVVAGGTQNPDVLSYAQLRARANQLAHRLKAVGLQANAPVGLLLDRSGDAIVGVLGILKAGGAYVPLSVDAPAPRLAQQLTESGAKIVVTSASLADRVPADTTVVALDRDAALLAALPSDPPAVPVSPADLAYVLYTSGSTGVPKGVAVTHANIVHYARAVSRVLADMPPTASGDGFAALDGWHFGMASTLAADLGNTSRYPALLSGGTLHMLATDITTEPAQYAEYVRAHPLDLLKITPRHLQALIAGKAGRDLAGVLPTRWVVLGGEALSPDFARTLLGAGSCRVLNHYGPTETTVGVCTFEATTGSLDAIVAAGAQTVPVGAPLANTQAFVVDAGGAERPVGVPGELWLGGAGVAQGYFKRPDLTAERFTMLGNVRVYRTGDRARRLPLGRIEFLGRIDDQVKVRGYRVELDEVAIAMRAHPGVSEAAVVLRMDDAGEPQLVGYAVPAPAGYATSHSDRATTETVRAWLAARLPEYMVPAVVMLLDAMPLTANGKVDRARLPLPDAAHDVHVEPRTEMERKLVAIWCQVLKKDRVGVTDDFLQLGGHSLLAIRILGKISQAFGVRLSLRALFDAPTVAQLAELVDVEKQLAALDALANKAP